jgi:DNA-binding FadR family transcriptional regulator
MEKPLRGPALNEVVRNYVKQYILEHNLSGGDPLPPENQLAEALGVGRGSVREAIKALQSLGIVEVRRGHGLYVREYNFDAILETFSYVMRFDTTTLLELMQARILLERAAIEDTITQIGPAELEQLEELMETWQQRVQAGQPYEDLDKEFHATLFRTLNNQTLVKLFEVFWIAFDNLDIEIIRQANPEEELKVHQAILEAVKQRDTVLARQLLVQHFTHLEDRINQAIQMEQN